MRNAFAKCLINEARRDSKIILITGDLGYGVLEEFEKELPNQFLNTGITEQSSISFASGLAKANLRPFFYSIGNFPTFRALEQIRNDVVHMQLPVTIVAVGAGFAYGAAGYSHHLVEDFAALSAFDLDIYTPSMPNEVELSVRNILERQRSAYLRIGKGGELNYSTSDHVYKFPNEFSQAPACDLSILVNGPIIEEAVIAAKKSAELGIRVNIFSCWSKDQLVSNSHLLGRSKKIITIEEHVIRGGFGSLVVELLGEKSGVEKIGIKHISHNINGSQKYLRTHYSLDADAILSKILEKR